MALNETELKILTDLKGDIGFIKAKMEDLAGPTGRITVLENDIKSSQRRQWWHSSVVVPISTVASLLGHGLLKKYGIQ